MSFVLPACRSSFSLLYGTASTSALLNQAHHYHYRNLLLADRSNLYGCYDFYYEASNWGIKPIIGANLQTAFGDLLLICENHEGFKSLSCLITQFQLQGEIPSSFLERNSRGLICITDDEKSMPLLSNIFQANFYRRFYDVNNEPEYQKIKKNGFKPIALPPVTFLKKEDYHIHRLLRAIDTGALLANLPQSEMAGPEQYLKKPEQYDTIYSPFPEAIKNNAELVEKCHLIFPSRKNILPDIIIDRDHRDKFRQDTLNGLRRKLGSPPGRYLARLEYESSIIERTGFTDYFLIVNEIIEFCRRQNITAVGRGSAAGSLVSYALGITQVDPIKEGLYFERFLNEARSDCPDIDIDIDWRYRDNVLNFIYRKYGEERTAMIATYIHFQPRLAIRESAKARGIPPDEIDRFIKRLPHLPLEELHRENEAIPKATRLKLDWERFGPALDGARALSSLPRHLGIHPGGIVITPQSLTDYIPLQRAAKGIVITQCDMHQAEKIGLVKIDILGQRGLAVITDCKAAVAEKQGDTFEIPDNDPATFETLRRGKTIGVFQIESPGLRALLKDLRPSCPNDITLALALIRPGASESGMKKVFLNRFHGKEKTSYPHPNLESILKETNGVFIYQEQVILAARKIAGFNLPASDMLRRAITKKHHRKEQEKIKRRFLDGARRCHVNEQTASNIYSQLAQFASFGFCKAHAATYGYLAYQSAYFKTHFPDIFMTAVLRNGGGYYPAAIYVAEARRLGVIVHPPNLNLSQKEDSLQNGEIYLGMTRIKELSSDVIEQIINGHPFNSFENFVASIDISKNEMDNLIRVGFFDSLDSSRPRLFWKYRLAGKRKLNHEKNLFKDGIASPSLKKIDLVPFSRYEIFKAEKEVLELSASFHPLTLFELYRAGDFDSAADQVSRPLTISGWLADRKRIKTKNGGNMVFLTFDSLDDTFEVVVFPDSYNRHSEIIRSYRYLTVEGKVNFDEGQPVIVADKIYPTPTGLTEIKYI
jgi:DNA-directed DNA polymerase III PolC